MPPAPAPARSTRSAALAAALTTAALATTAPATALGQRNDGSITAPANRSPYVARPITTAHRHLNIYAGVGAEYVDYYRSYNPRPGHALGGIGTHLAISYGVLDNLEVGAGVGLRWTGSEADVPYISPDRYARINREWLPTGSELARTPGAPASPGLRALVQGPGYLTNPYVQARLAFVNRPPVMVGLELIHNIPIFTGSCFAPTLGVPLHFSFAQTVRIETGVYNEFVLCGVAPDPNISTRYWTLMIPFRLLVQVVPRFWVGVRSGFETVGYSLDSRNFAIPLGVQAGIRLLPRLDLVFHVVAPEFIHTDVVTGRNVWLDRIGTGVAIQAWLL